MRLARLCAIALALAAGCAHGPQPFDHRAERLDRLLATEAREPDRMLERGWALFVSGCDWTRAAGELAQAAASFAPQRRHRRQLAQLGLGLVHFAAAEFHRAMDAFVAAVETDPRSGEGLIAAHHLSQTAADVPGGPDRLEFRIERLLSANAPERPAPEVARALRLMLRDAALRRGEWRRAVQFEQDLGVVPVWRAAQPFGRHPLLGFERGFPPETAPLEAHSLPPGTVLRPVWPEGGSVAFDAQQQDGVVYAETYFRLPRAASLALRLAGPGSWAVFVDDRPLDVHAAHRRHLPQVARRRFSASAGWHRLLLKVPLLQDEARVSVELTAVDGRPAEVAWWRWPGRIPSYRPQGARALPAAGEGLGEQLGERAAVNPNDAVASLLAGLLEWNIGDRFRARAHFFEASRRASSFALPEFFIGLTMLEDPELPAEVDRVRSLEHLGRSLTRCPDFHLARFHLARLEGEQGREERALVELTELDHARPTSFLWPFYAGRIQEKLGWEEEALRSYRRALSRMPDRREILRRLFDLAGRRRAFAREVQLAERLEELGHWEEGQVSVWLGRGQPKRAGELLERIVARHPGRLAARLQLVDVLSQQDRLHLATRQLDACEAIFAHRIEVQSRRADLLDRQNRSGRADAIRAALARRHPWYLPGRRRLGAIDGSGIRVAGGPRLDGMRIIAAHKASGFSARGEAVLLLDQASVEVAADGSSLERVHTIVQLLSAEGLERWGEIDRIPPGAEVEQLRTIGADGRIHDAELIPGKESITMPALQAGDFVEIAYVYGRRGGGPIARSFLTRDFLFSLPGTPIRHSLYTVAVPTGCDLVIDAFNGAPEPRVRREGRFDVYTFERRDTPGLEPALHAPLLREYAPVVRLGFGVGWRDLRDVLRAELALASRLTPSLVRYARAAAGEDGDARTRLRRLYRRVLDEVRQVGEADDFRRSAAHVLAAREGNRLVLLYALAKALGFRPRVLLARTLAHAQLAYRLPAEDSYSHGLLAVDDPRSAARTVWLDPAERFNAFDALYAHLAGMPALVVTSEDPDALFVQLPAKSHEGGKRIELDLELLRDGTLVGSGRETISTVQAVRYRSMLVAMSPSQRRQALESGLGGNFSGAVLEDYEIRSLQDPSQPLEIAYRFRAPAFARPQKEGLVLRGGFYPYELTANLITGAERRTPLLVTDMTRTQTRVAIQLPAGARVEVPPPTRWSGPLGEFSMEVRQVGRRLLIDKRLVIRPGRVQSADYPAFRRFCRHVDERDTEGIVVRFLDSVG